MIKKEYVSIIILMIILNSCTVKNKLVLEKNSNSRLKKFNYEYAYIEATKQKLLGNYNAALSYYQSCLKTHKYSSAAAFEISTIYSILKNNELAIEYAEKAVKFDPSNIWYKLNLVQQYYINNQLENAIEIYKDIVKLYPENIDYKNDLIVLNIENSDYKSALRYYDEIERTLGVNEIISLAKVQIYLKIEKNQLAYDELNKLISFYPDNSKYYGILAEQYAKNSLVEEAREQYKRLFEIDKENPSALISYQEFERNNGNYNVVFELLNRIVNNENITIDTKIYVLMQYIQDEDEFVKYINEIESLINGLYNIYPNKIKVQALNADFLIKCKRYEEAEKQLRELISINNKDYYLWEQLLFIESYMEKYESMYDDSKTAINLFIDIPNIYFLNAIAAIQLQKYNEALTSLNSGLPLITDNRNLTIQFYIYFAESYNGLKDYKNSDKYFEKVLQLEPENNIVLNNYSYYLSLREEKLDKAELMSKKCIAQEPNNSTYLDTYAWVLYKLGKYSEAKTMIEKAIKLGGENSEEIIEHYGDILFITGNKELALKYWIKARTKGRDTKELNEKINSKTLK